MIVIPIWLIYIGVITYLARAGRDNNKYLGFWQEFLIGFTFCIPVPLLLSLLAIVFIR